MVFATFFSEEIFTRALRMHTFRADRRQTQLLQMKLGTVKPKIYIKNIGRSN